MSFPDNYKPNVTITMEQIVKIIKDLEEEMKTIKREGAHHYSAGYYAGLKKASEDLKGLFDSSDRAWLGIISGDRGDYDYRW